MFGRHKQQRESQERYQQRSDRAQALRHAIDLHTNQGLSLKAEDITATANTFYSYLVLR